MYVCIYHIISHQYTKQRKAIKTKRTLHEELHLSLAQIPFRKVRPQLNAFLGVFQSLGHGAKLDIGGGSVAVGLIALGVGVGGAALEGLGVKGDGFGVPFFFFFRKRGGE